MNEQYTDEILAVVCPTCHAVGKCLKKVKDGSKYIETPHEERVQCVELARHIRSTGDSHMIIQLSPKAIEGAKDLASKNDKTPQQFIEFIVEAICNGETAHFGISPPPPADRVNAIHAAIRAIASAEQFFGFKLLSEQEAQAEKEKLAKEYDAYNMDAYHPEPDEVKP